MFIAFVNYKLLKAKAYGCVEGGESSISLSLCGSQEFSPESFPDGSLCVDAEDTSLGKLNKGLQHDGEDRVWTGAPSVVKASRASPWRVTGGPNLAEGPWGWGKRQETAL